MLVQGKKQCQAKALPALDFLDIIVKTERKHKVPPQLVAAESGASWWCGATPGVSGFTMYTVASAWQEPWVLLSDSLLHGVHGDVVVIASNCQMRPVWVESQAADGSDTLAHEPVIVLDVVDQLAISIVDGSELVHGATCNQVCLGVDVQGRQPLYDL